MSKKNRFLEGVFIGALIGGAYTLFDRDTREAVLNKGKEVAQKTAKWVQSPAEISANIADCLHEVKSTMQEINEDITFVTEKVHELKESTPKMIELVKDTKAVLVKDKG